MTSDLSHSATASSAFPAPGLAPLSTASNSSPISLPSETASSQASDESLSVTDIVRNLGSALDRAVRDILKVNSSTKVLALNARIEASRAGEHGAAFGIVAQEMQRLSERTSEIAAFMADQTQRNTQQLMAMISWHIRGQRLSDQALMNIDLIDRCLYERTCDVRWWATDSAVVDALSDPARERLQHASKRLGVILKAYTVYFDLVLCGSAGNINANGRPDQYAVVGSDESRREWFTSALKTNSGDEFGFEIAPRCALVAGANSLIYSCAVRERGETLGRKLGALGIVFNWDGLAQSILQKTASAEAGARCYIVDSTGCILAADNAVTKSRIELPDFNRILATPKGYFIDTIEDQLCCIAFAASPGFETYATGWYSLIIQPLD